MDYHHKYQRKGHYLLHPSIIEFKRSGWGFQIKFNVILLLILGTMRMIPTSFMAFDIMFAFLVAGFWLIGRSLLLTGRLPIQTYYKRDYQTDNFLFFCKMLTHGSVVRAITILSFYLFNLYLAKGDIYDTRIAINDIKQILINPIPQTIAVIAFLCLFYYMFMKEKYVTIKAFSDEVMSIVQTRRIPINQAVREFIIKRDAVLEKELFNHVKYDTNKVGTSETVKDNGQKIQNEESSFKESRPPVVQPEVSTPLRRQSRR